VKRFSKSLAAGVTASALAISGLAVALTATANSASATTTSQLAGVDRYDTARLAALSVYPINTNAVLASGQNFPDGLAAADLAGSLSAPLLLTPSASLAPETVAALASENVHNIFVVGGSAAVSTTVITQLQGLGYTVTVISGADRYATSAAVASSAVNSAPVGTVGGLKTAILATGANFPDALAAGSASFVGHLPILLTDPNTLSTSVSTELTTLGIKNVIIMGGTSAVSAAVETAVKALGLTTQRVMGATRYDTATAMATLDITPVFSGGIGLSAANVVLASGLNFPDALVSAELKSPIVLDGTGLPTQTAAWLTANGALIANVQAVGGTAVIPAADLAAALAAVAPSAGTVTFAAVAGGTSFTATFSAAVNTPTVGNFLVNNALNGRGLNAGAVTQTGLTTFLVSGLAALQAGDVIAVNTAAPPTNAAGQAVTGTTFTVPANAAPVVNSVQFFTGGGFVSVQFSKPVAAGTLAAGVTCTCGALTHLAGAAGTSADGATVTFSTAAAIIASNTLTISTAITDLNAVALPATVNYAPTANTVAPVINANLNTPVNTAPLTTIEGTYTGGAPIGLAGADTLVISAKPGGGADGALGGAFLVATAVPVAGQAAVSVTAATVAGATTLTISVPAGVYASGQALAAALNANATFNSVFVANGTGATAIVASTATAGVALAGGTSFTAVSLILNKAVVPNAAVTATAKYTASSGAVPIAVTLNNTAAPSIITVTFSETTAAMFIVNGTTTLSYLGGGVDFAGNAFAAQTVTVA
jgi:putative cell wall-binding protein